MKSQQIIKIFYARFDIFMILNIIFRGEEQESRSDADQGIKAAPVAGQGFNSATGFNSGFRGRAQVFGIGLGHPHGAGLAQLFSG